MTRALIAAGVVAALAALTPAAAQGQGNGQGQGQGPKPGKGQTKTGSTPPSRNDLASPAVSASPGGGGATPLAWIDDATLLDPGAASLAVSTFYWHGSGIGEVNVPIVDGAIGLAPRVQISASVPHAVGSGDPDGSAGGIGTSFFTAKIAVFENQKRGFRVAVAPTLEVLGGGVVAALGADEGRLRWGLPVSAEVDRGALRLYGGGGHFSPGLWYGGLAIGIVATPRTGVTAGFSRAWRSTDSTDVPLAGRDRKDLSGGVSYAWTPRVSLFGSLGRTIATLDENGAGTTLAGGVSFYFAPASTAP